MLYRYKRAPLIFLLYILPATGLWAELQTIYLRNGQILRGEVVQQTATSMRIKTEDGTIRQLDKKQIRRVSYKEPTAQEKKEAEEKAKQEVAPVAPVVPEPVPGVVDTSKPASLFDIDQSKRNDLEIFVGAGLGRYQPDSEGLSNRVSAKASLYAGGTPIATDKPAYKAGLADSIALTYYWRKFSFGFSGNHFQSQTSERMKVYNTSTSYQDISGTFPEKQSAMKGDISFLAFTNNRLDLRPSLGYSQFWGKTDDNSTLSINLLPQGLGPLTKYHYTYLENLKGPSVGLKTTIRMGERWENRLEFHYLTLSGAQHGSALLTFLTPGLPVDFANLTQEASWKANGFNFVYKLVFRLTPTLSFWIGAQTYEWKYSLNSFSQGFQDLAGGAASALPADVAFLQNFLVESIAKSSTTTSKSSALEIGIAKRFEFSK